MPLRSGNNAASKTVKCGPTPHSGANGMLVQRAHAVLARQRSGLDSPAFHQRARVEGYDTSLQDVITGRDTPRVHKRPCSSKAEHSLGMGAVPFRLRTWAQPPSGGMRIQDDGRRLGFHPMQCEFKSRYSLECSRPAGAGSWLPSTVRPVRSRPTALWHGPRARNADCNPADEGATPSLASTGSPTIRHLAF